MIISPDDFRYRYDSEANEVRYVFQPDVEPYVWGRAYMAFIAALPYVETAVVLVGAPGSGKSTWAKERLGNNLFFDATNTTVKERRTLIAFAHVHDTPIAAIHFDTPLEVCLQRNQGRLDGRLVPSDIIKAMVERLVVPTLSEGFIRVETIRYET